MSKANEKAYELIRDAILDGRFSPGEHLAEQKIAESTGVSRTPVREALRRLEAEHFVIFRAHRGAYVADWSPEVVDDIFNLRVLLEGYAAARAATRTTPEQLQQLEECIAQISQALPAQCFEDYQAVMVANNRFHNILLEAAGSERLSALLPSLIHTPMVLRTLNHYGEDDLKRSNRHHEELVAACKARDAEWARNVMAAHLRAAHRIYHRRSDPAPTPAPSK